MRGGCYPPRLKTEVNNILRDLHNSSHHTKVEFNNCLLFIQNISKFLTSLPPRRLTVSGYKKILNLADTLQQVDKIHRATCFAYSFISSIQSKAGVQLFRLRKAVKAIFLVHFCPGSLISNQIYHRIDSILLTSSKFGKRPLVMKN